MLKYAAKRLGMGLVTLFVLATATFFLMKAIPGSPFGAEVSQMSAAAVEKLYEKYDLDKSIPEQYVIYIKNVLHNDFGESMTRKGISVNSIIAKALPITAKLGGVAFVFSMVTGIVLGIIAALSKRQWVQNSVMIFATVGVSVPSFLYALMLMTVFGVILQWLPFIGLKTPLHYILPAFSLSLYPISMVARLVRSSMTEAMKQDYMVLAKSKGTSPIKLIVKHALKNCLIPVVTYAGPLVAYLMTGSFVIESIFSIPGLGGEFVTSVTNRDYPLIMALTIFFGAFIIFTNLVSDLLTAMIDPRIKLEKRKAA
ncbi:ABC transporter permease [Merdimmobilis hominis]|jgi:oligopeptide transport system permease protein|uniref:Dipeptide transport system permease protein DppB n=1 Tax=uncultured Anaerotruncus sp. TaxID=905011 RepID=A0A6N2UKD4_9FIRM|nr:ABC transporter permease [Merdimmobilis hominis]MCD4835286.1 ABC transporter permease [Merdimmobilis hominis]PWL62820.1 MAG: ABC transporter permease [Oscillospiraceae bacterium]